MSQTLEQLLRQMSTEERKEVTFFATFVIARRNLQKFRVLTDDISIQELMKRTAESGGFDWLDLPDEDIYSLEDGAEVEWPEKS
jgi:hypothetical protein